MSNDDSASSESKTQQSPTTSTSVHTGDVAQRAPDHPIGDVIWADDRSLAHTWRMTAGLSVGIAVVVARQAPPLSLLLLGASVAMAVAAARRRSLFICAYGLLVVRGQGFFQREECIRWDDVVDYTCTRDEVRVFVKDEVDPWVWNRDVRLLHEVLTSVIHDDESNKTS